MEQRHGVHAIFDADSIHWADNMTRRFFRRHRKGRLPVQVTVMFDGWSGSQRGEGLETFILSTATQSFMRITGRRNYQRLVHAALLML